MSGLLASLTGLVSGAISALKPTASAETPSTTASEAAAEGVTAAAGALPSAVAAPKAPTMLPVKVLYATTTGTSQRYADLLRREAFAMNVSGFHFDVQLVNAANYDTDKIEEERVVVFLMPTWTGGVPPASGLALFEAVRDLATDFRVSKDALSKLQYAVFGLGCSEYAAEKNFCRAAIELDGHLRALGASRLAPVGKGDDSSDMDNTFAEWRQQGLWPALCELYASRFGEDADEEDEDAGAEGGTNGCGPTGCGTAGSDGGTTSDGRLRKMKAPSQGAGSSGFYDDAEVDDDGDDDFGASASASASASSGGCCKDEDDGTSGSKGACCGGGGAAASKGVKAGGCGCQQEEDSEPTPSASSATTAGLSKKQRKYLERQQQQQAAITSSTFVAPKEFRKMKKLMSPQEKKAFEATRRAMAMAAAGVSATATSSKPSEAKAEPSKAVRFAAGAADDAEEEDGDDVDIEADEEDRINDALLALEPDNEGGSSSCRSGPAVVTSGSSSSSSAGAGLEDMEDLGAAMHRAAIERAAEAEALAKGAPRDMLTPAQRRALGKEGYQLIGSHSAVKICRWVKASLRGRGYCYKNAAYGIVSYLCIEATPSLACANKCVFCWRKLKNPVGREWRWRVDEPTMIVEAAVEKHVAQIKTLKGLPGIRLDRWKEAFTPRHCALSLVGEPIFYPRIAELVKLLHKRLISTFLVTNAQFPDCMAALPPVTQLYVSIDAATRDTLKAIDRPLFADFWERFLASLDQLRDRQQRTVYRLTLVKGKDDDVGTDHHHASTAAGADEGSASSVITSATDASTAASIALAAAVAEKASKRPDHGSGSAGNMRDLREYAALVGRGRPDFVEVKGVTWCGTSPGSNLTMQNVPFHHEVKAFCEALCEALGGEYGLAVEHAHSCLVVLAKKDPFFVPNPEGGATTTVPTTNASSSSSLASAAASAGPGSLIRGDWWTWIDYPKFFALFEKWEASNGKESFSSADYMARTPEWALYGSEQAGFEPGEVRHHPRSKVVLPSAAGEGDGDGSSTVGDLTSFSANASVAGDRDTYVDPYEASDSGCG